MPFYIIDNGVQYDISTIVQRETVKYHATLSVDIDAKGGESTLEFGIIVNPSISFKPRSGVVITWIGDDQFGTTIFSGLIKECPQVFAGFNEAGQAVMHYNISARDPSVLMEKKITEKGILNQKATVGATDKAKITSSVIGTPATGLTVVIKAEQQFPDFIGNNPGELMDLMAIGSEPRLGLPTDNDDAGTDAFKMPFDYELGRMTYKDAIDQLAREAGLLWWVDSQWQFHHKSFPTIYNTLQDEFFDIDDFKENYYDLNVKEDTEKWVSRVKVIGNVYDAGDVNPQNRKQGKQKREEIEIVVTGTVDKINAIRERIGYDPLPPNTDVDMLPDTEPGLWITSVSAPNVYVQKSSGDPDPTRPDYSLLRQIGQAYLLRYGQPDIMGSVNYTGRPPKVGLSINIFSEQRGLDIRVPIVEVEIDTSGRNQGNDENGERVYEYHCQFRGPSMKLKYMRVGVTGEIVRARPERALKPNPPTITGATVYSEATGEVLSQMGTATVTGTVITPNYTTVGSPFGGDTSNTYPDTYDSAPNSPAPGGGYEKAKKFYPPIKKPWTISSGFGNRIHPVTGEPSFHPGIDIDAATGSPIYAIFDGTIVVAENNPHVNLAGKYIKLNTTEGHQAVYMHLQKIIVPQGSSVKRGQIIGYTDNTGRSTGPHLHFGVFDSLGTPLDPTGFQYYDDREAT